MHKVKKQVLPVLVSALAIVALAVTPALAKDSKSKNSSNSAAKVAAASVSNVPEQREAPTADRHDEKPGPAWMTLGGTVKKIEGNAYTVEDYEGNRVKLYVGQGTKQLKNKKVGDPVRAEITRGGFANSVQ